MTIEQIQQIVPKDIKVYQRRKWIDFRGEQLYMDTVTLRKGKFVIRMDEEETLKGGDEYIKRKVRGMVRKLNEV